MTSYNVLLWQLKLPLPPQRQVSQDCIVNAILPLMYHQTGIPICGIFLLKTFHYIKPWSYCQTSILTSIPALPPRSRLLPPPSRASSLTHLLPHAPPSHPLSQSTYARKPGPLNVSNVQQDCTPGSVILPVILYIRQPWFLIDSLSGEVLAMPSKPHAPLHSSCASLGTRD